MRYGIDFGTTRTVVACCDRGNYPVLTFEDAAGDSLDWFPSVVAERRGELRFAFDAEAVAGDPDWTVLRSFKRLFSGGGCAPDFEVEIGSTRVAGSELLARFLAALKTAILTRSNRPRAGADEDGAMEVVVATPASAHGTQRFLTLDAFRRAGFHVLGMLNEPSAAGFEYTQRFRSSITSRREHIVVYDLGGGTFDASLVRVTGKSHDAIATAGSTIGGDDFDAVLVDLALAEAGIERRSLTERGLRLLSGQCRDAKERIHPTTKRVALDLEPCLGSIPAAATSTKEVSVSVADYFAACAPLVDATVAQMAPVLAKLGATTEEALGELAGVYVVGGASALPVVSRVLKDTFGRRVHRSAHPSGAIAMGLAIAADEDAGFELSDRLSRHFGVFREQRGGADVTFDPIFDRETRVPHAGESAVTKRRVYRAAHNLGRYRFVECGALDANGVPIGDLTAYADVLFPFDRDVRGERDLTEVPVRRITREGYEGPLIEERYTVTPLGLVAVTITDLDSGFARTFEVGA